LLGRPAATTFDLLAYHAAVHPARTALIIGSESFTFERLHADTMRFSKALAEMDVSSGQLVLVSHPSLYVEWLLLIACENVGAISASYPTIDVLASIRTRERADFVFANAAVPPAGGSKAVFKMVDQGWLKTVFGRNLRDVRDHPRVVLGPDEAQRLTHSSGTTGTPKAMLLRRGAQEAKLRDLWQSTGHSSETRLLVTMPFSVNSTYLQATLCLRLGALVVVAPLPTAVCAHQVTYFEALPLMLHQLLRQLPPDFVKPPKLEVRVIGAPLTNQLREMALKLLCTDISCRYAANEVWPIATDMNADQIGTLFPGVDVRILDDRGEEVAAGQVGHVAVRSPSMVEGYFDDPKATQAHFRDGWFLTGDLGRALPRRQLQLVGRSDELLNQGGLKVSPDPIEAKIRAIRGVVDVAVTSVTSDSAIDDLCVAIVLEGAVDPAGVLPQINAAAAGWLRMNVKVLRELPKTANGKLNRAALRRLFEAT
jgi:acyl-CoA synthetase (AMP-forming)/AMP-acid ligase II